MSEKQKIIDDLSMFGNAFTLTEGKEITRIDPKDALVWFDEESTLCGNWFTKQPYMSIRKRKTLDQIKEIVKLKK